MNTRQMTVVATIAVIVLLAVGIGYAYTATTINSNNTTTAQYITLEQYNGSNPQYTFTNNAVTEYFDSISMSAEGANYRINEESAATGGDAIAGYTLIKIGDDITVKAVPHGYDSLTALPTLTMDFTSTGFVAPTASLLHYYLVKDGNIVAYTTNSNTWSATSLSFTKNSGDEAPVGYQDMTLKLYYGYANADLINGTAANSGYLKVYVPYNDGTNAPQNLNGTISFVATVNTSS